MIVVLFALISGVLSGALSDFDSFFIPGVLFALAILAGSRSRFERVGLLRALGLVVMSAAANCAAVRSAIWVSGPQLPWRELIEGGLAGLVGSILLAVALRITLRMKPLSRTLLPCAVVGTVAGVLFFYMPNEILGYALWQGAMACVIARAWALRAR